MSGNIEDNDLPYGYTPKKDSKFKEYDVGGYPVWSKATEKTTYPFDNPMLPEEAKEAKDMWDSIINDGDAEQTT